MGKWHKDGKFDRVLTRFMRDGKNATVRGWVLNGRRKERGIGGVLYRLLACEGRLVPDEAPVLCSLCAMPMCSRSISTHSVGSRGRESSARSCNQEPKQVRCAL